MKKNSILYIGNNLVSKTKYSTMMETLSNFFIEENIKVYKASNKIKKLHRLLDMLFSIVKYRNKVDVVLIDTYSTTNFYYAYLSARVCNILKLKYVPILHGGNLPKRLRKSPQLSKYIFSKAYKNVAPSMYLKTAFETKGFETEFIPNVLPIYKYTKNNRVKISPKLLYVRAFAKIYNLKMAIDVLKILTYEYPDAELCIIGPDRDGSKKETVDYIHSLGLANNVEITGVLTKEEWHEKSVEFDVFINTTNIDNTPVSVIEAMALGLPIVSTNVGGLPYLIDNNIDGLLVNRNDVHGMVDKINFLIENPKHAINLSAKARKKAEQFDWDVVKKKWFKILE